MESRSEKLKQAMEDFCIRVLAGGAAPQEIATLPAILRILLAQEK